MSWLPSEHDVSLQPYQCNNDDWAKLYRFDTLKSRQNGRHFADDIFKRIFLNETLTIAIKISLNFVPKGPIYNIPALVQIMAWRLWGDKPLSEPMMVSLLMHICVTRPQWVNPLRLSAAYKHIHMNQPSLIQIMACRLVGTKPLSENVVCEMVTTLSGLQCVEIYMLQREMSMLISYVTMPWLLVSPGHQQPWLWICKIKRFFSSTRKEFNYQWHHNVKKLRKIYIDDLLQDCSNSIASTLELLQYCTKPSICFYVS